jgi:hypothetical protein
MTEPHLISYPDDVIFRCIDLSECAEKRGRKLPQCEPLTCRGFFRCKELRQQKGA